MGPRLIIKNFGYPDQIEEYLLLRGTGSVWHEDHQRALEAGQEAETEEGFLDSTW